METSARWFDKMLFVDRSNPEVFIRHRNDVEGYSFYVKDEKGSLEIATAKGYEFPETMALINGKFKDGEVMFVFDMNEGGSK